MKKLIYLESISFNKTGINIKKSNLIIDNLPENKEVLLIIKNKKT